MVPKLLPHLANAVRRRMKQMLGSRLVATGCLPPVNILADKATHQRWSRQFVGAITVNPGAFLKWFMIKFSFSILFRWRGASRAFALWAPTLLWWNRTAAVRQHCGYFPAFCEGWTGFGFENINVT